MRLFIAIQFDEEIKNHIVAVQRRLKSVGRGNFSRNENLHLTLVFLGEVSPLRIPTIRQVMDQLSTPSLRLNFDHIGCFSREGGDVWWIGLQKNDALMRLQNQLSQELRTCGFALENRSFKPHLTLARQVRLKNNFDRNWLLTASFSTHVNEISLMCSERVNGVLTYSEVYKASGQS